MMIANFRRIFPFLFSCFNGIRLAAEIKRPEKYAATKFKGFMFCFDLFTYTLFVPVLGQALPPNVLFFNALNFYSAHRRIRKLGYHVRTILFDNVPEPIQHFGSLVKNWKVFDQGVELSSGTVLKMIGYAPK